MTNPDGQPRPEQALIDFREDVLKVLAQLHVEIQTLRRAVLQEEPITEQRLQETRRGASGSFEAIHDQLAQRIRLAY